MAPPLRSALISPKARAAQATIFPTVCVFTTLPRPAEARFALSALPAWRARRGEPESLGETLLRRQVATACHRAELAMGRAQQELWRLKEQRAEVAWRALASGMLLRRLAGSGVGGGAAAEAKEGYEATAASLMTPEAKGVPAHSGKAVGRSPPRQAPPPTPRLHMATPQQTVASGAAAAPARRPPHLATPPTPASDDEGGASSPESSLFAAGGAAAAAAGFAAPGGDARRRPSPLAVAGGGASPYGTLDSGGGQSRASSDRVLKEIEALLFSRHGGGGSGHLLPHGADAAADGRSSSGSSGIAFRTRSPGAASDGPPTPDPLAPLPLPLSPEAMDGGVTDAAAAAAAAAGGAALLQAGVVAEGEVCAERSLSPPLPSHPADYAAAPAAGGGPSSAIDASGGRQARGQAPHSHGDAQGGGVAAASPGLRLRSGVEAALQLSGAFASVADMVASSPAAALAHTPSPPAAAASFALAQSPQRAPGAARATAGGDAAPPPPAPCCAAEAPAAAARAPASPQLVTPARNPPPAAAAAAAHGFSALGARDFSSALQSPPVAMPAFGWATAPPADGYLLSGGGLLGGSPTVFYAALAAPTPVGGAAQESPLLFPEHQAAAAAAAPAHYFHAEKQQRDDSLNHPHHAPASLPPGFFAAAGSGDAASLRLQSAAAAAQGARGESTPQNRRFGAPQPDAAEEHALRQHPSGAAAGITPSSGSGHDHHAGGRSSFAVPAIPTAAPVVTAAAAAAAAEKQQALQTRRAQMLAAAGLHPRDWESLTLRSGDTPGSEEPPHSAGSAGGGAHSHSRRYGSAHAAHVHAYGYGGLGTVEEGTEPQHPPPAPASEASGAMPVRHLAFDDAREGPTPERFRSPFRRGASAGATRSRSPYTQSRAEQGSGSLLRFPTRKARRRRNLRASQVADVQNPSMSVAC